MPIHLSTCVPYDVSPIFEWSSIYRSCLGYRRRTRHSGILEGGDWRGMR